MWQGLVQVRDDNATKEATADLGEHICEFGFVPFWGGGAQ